MQELVVVVDPDFLQVSPPRCIYITKSVSHHKSNVRRKIILILKSMWKRKGKGMENWLMNWSYPIPFYIYYLLRDYVDACACDLSCVKLCFFFFFCLWLASVCKVNWPVYFIFLLSSPLSSQIPSRVVYSSCTWDGWSACTFGMQGGCTFLFPFLFHINGEGGRYLLMLNVHCNKSVTSFSWLHLYLTCPLIKYRPIGISRYI